MTLYTILPDDRVWEGFDDIKSTTQDIVVNGMLMEVEPLNEYKAKIIRIYSANPQDYLNPNVAPGEIISFMPTVR